VQTLPARPGLPELILPTKPNPPNSNTPETNGMLFNINKLANKYKSKQPKQEDYSNNPKTYKKAIIY
jgi:hypothetical protein